MSSTEPPPWKPTHEQPFPPIIDTGPAKFPEGFAYFDSIVRRLYAGGKDDDERFKKRIRKKKSVDSGDDEA